MKPFFCKTAIGLSLTLPAAANATEYVCNIEGITVYASYQISDACRIVEANNVTENSVVAIPGDTPVLKSEEQAAKPIATVSAEPTATPVEHGKTTVPTPFPQAYKPAADILLDKGNNDSDIKILPNVPITSVTNTAEAANPRLNIILRNRPGKARTSSYSKYKAPVIRTAPMVTPAPKPSPKETRKQILQTEVHNEQTAITRLQTQLNAAKQKGDQIKIQQLTRTINDRKANIRAIQGEMSR